MAESRRKESRIKQQVDKNKEVVLDKNDIRKPRKPLRPTPVKPIEPIKPIKPVKPIKKRRVLRALEKIEKKFNFNFELVTRDKRPTETLDPKTKTEKEEFKVMLSQLSDKDILDILKDINNISITRNSGNSKKADVISWKQWTNKYSNNPHKNALGDARRMYHSLDYEHNFKSKHIVDFNRIKISAFLLELKKEILHMNNVKVGNKAFKEKKYNSISQGPM